MDNLKAFIEKSQLVLNSCKDNYVSNFTELSQQNVPDLINSDRGDIHSTDYRLLLYSWFIESVCDIEKIDCKTTKARIWSWVQEGLTALTYQEVQTSLVQLITEEIYNQFSVNSKRNRGRWSIGIKDSLIAKYSRPCCWICKREFTEAAISNFTTRGKKIVLAPSPSLDYMFPRGLNSQDLRIEVEHVIPFSRATNNPDDLDNLELACGWCNNAKSNHMSIYTTSRNGKYYHHPSLGLRSIPNRYWIVKLFMLHEKCEVCKKVPKIDKNKLRFTLKNKKGVANINNLKVVCGICDDMRGDRLVNATDYNERIIKKKSNFI